MRTTLQTVPESLPADHVTNSAAAAAVATVPEVKSHHTTTNSVALKTRSSSSAAKVSDRRSLGNDGFFIISYDFIAVAISFGDNRFVNRWILVAPVVKLVQFLRTADDYFGMRIVTVLLYCDCSAIWRFYRRW